MIGLYGGNIDIMAIHPKKRNHKPYVWLCMCEGFETIE